MVSGGQFGNWAFRRSIERKNLGLVPASLDETDQIARCDPRCRGILERMKINLVEFEQRGVDHGCDMAAPIVDQRKRRHRARCDAEHFGEQLRLAEAESARAEPF